MSFLTDTKSPEYVKWMASVWKANDERNKRIEAEKLKANKQE